MFSAYHISALSDEQERFESHQWGVLSHTYNWTGWRETTTRLIANAHPRRPFAWSIVIMRLCGFGIKDELCTGCLCAWWGQPVLSRPAWWSGLLLVFTAAPVDWQLIDKASRPSSWIPLCVRWPCGEGRQGASSQAWPWGGTIHQSKQAGRTFRCWGGRAGPVCVGGGGGGRGV